MEAHNEDVVELSVENRRAFDFREDSKREVIVSGLKHVTIFNVEGEMNSHNHNAMWRTTTDTLMNHAFSRSHATLTILLVWTDPSVMWNSNEHVSMTASSWMRLISLVDSEEKKRISVEGERKRECSKTNEGSLELGNIIAELADEERLSN